MNKAVNKAKYIAIAAAVATLPGCGSDNADTGQTPSTDNVPSTVATPTTAPPIIDAQPDIPAVAFTGSQAYIQCLDDSLFGSVSPELFSVLTGEDNKVVLSIGPHFHFVGENAPDYVKAQLSDLTASELELQPDTDPFVIAFHSGKGGDLHFALSVSPDRQVIASQLGSNDIYDVLSEVGAQKIQDVTLASYTVGQSPLTQVYVKGPRENNFRNVPASLNSEIEGFETTGLSLQSSLLHNPGDQAAIATIETATGTSVGCLAQASR